MDKDNIDASLGLVLSLPLLERYRKNGLLQAEIHHAPGYRGRCKGFLHLVQGKVVACYIEDKNSQRHHVSKEFLMKVDSERGPFKWELTSLPAPPSLTAQPEIPIQPTSNAPVPVRIAQLNLDMLEGWTSHQKVMLSTVYNLIDGQHNIESIKRNTSLPATIAEEALRVLLAMRVIKINTSDPRA